MSTVIPPREQATIANAGLSFRSRCAAALRAALPAELKAHGAALPAVDIDAMAESLARQLTKLTDEPSGKRAGKTRAEPHSEWISTQEAADRCGFSRPFVAALLDSGTYPGKVQRSPGGHRKVLASEFEALMAKASSETPRTMAQARKAVDLNLRDSAEQVSSTERKQSRSRAQALAKKLGLAA